MTDEQSCGEENNNGLSDTLGHVQWSQHLLEDGPLHVGASQISLLKVTAGQVTVLSEGRREGEGDERENNKRM